MFENASSTLGVPVFANGTASNATDNGEDPMIWKWPQCAQIVLTLFALVFNGVILFLLLRINSHQTAFNVYLINLTAINLVNAVFQCPFDIYSALFRTWHLGTKWCSYYLYWGFILQPYLYVSHALISLTRVWAYGSPLTYRQKHTKRLATCLCLGSLLFIHCAHLPVFILDASWYRLQEDQSGCLPNVDAQFVVSTILYLILYDLPVFAVAAVYPWILYKHLQRFRKRAALLHPTTSKGRTTKSVDANSTDTTGLESGNSNRPKNPAGVAPQTRGFLIVTILTLTSCVSFWPINLFFTFTHLAPELATGDFYIVATMLIYLEAVLDPIYFVITMRELRLALRVLFSQKQA